MLYFDKEKVKAIILNTATYELSRTVMVQSVKENWANI